MHITESDILAIPYAETYPLRHKGTDYAIHPHIYHFDILTIGHFCHITIRPFTTFFLKLESINFPVGHIMETGFSTDMMLQRHGINTSRSLRFANIKPTGSIRTSCPNILNCPAAIVCNPQTPILVVPSHILTGFHDRRRRGTNPTLVPAVRRLSGSIRSRFAQGTVPAYKLHIIQVRALTRHPFTADSTVIIRTGINTYAIQHVVATFGRFNQRHRHAETTECRLAFLQQKLSPKRMQPNQLSTGRQLQRSRQAIPTLGHIDVFMQRDSFLKNFRIISLAITFCP